MYRPLVSQIENARNKSAVFYKVDLHIHTHESIDDFPKLGDKPGSTQSLSSEDQNPTPAHYISAGKKANLRLMAITDHNRSKVAEQISLLSDDELIVLPGMEVSVKNNFFPDSVVHILAIFPENYTSVDIDKVFANGNMPLYTQRKHDSVLGIPVADFISTVRSQKGIVIASHVNSNKGLRTLFRESNIKLLRTESRKRLLQSLKEKGIITTKEEQELESLKANFQNLNDDVQNQFLYFLAENCFDAIEIQNSDQRQYYSGTHVDDLGIKPIACLLNSDSHNLEDIGLPGFTTHIKMTKPSFKDLQKALRDPGTRIRFDNEINQSQVARILGIKFDGGYFQQHVIGFSDNLTCLIGGRGSGKSATIEALRYIFDIRNPTSDSNKQKDISGRLDYTLHDTEIKVLFSDAVGDIYVLKRRFGETHTDCFDINGNLHNDINVAVASNLKVKIYGWGEIEELAKNKRDQLNLIDGFVENVADSKRIVDDLFQELNVIPTNP
jgi:hypothetical protein